ncbi:MAG: electron transport protein SCO1/SenC [Verrucomicrobiaceae bacterium]|nr:electron transport protein SCO1/SenC [Verrucomicrobiaceae bacterium]
MTSSGLRSLVQERRSVTSPPLHYPQAALLSRSRCLPRLAVILVVVQAMATVLLPAAEGKPPRQWTVRGVIRELRPATGEVVIKHADIPGYMEAMTMPFKIHDPALIKGLHVGDTINFTLVATDEDGWIEHVEKLSSAAAVPIPAPPLIVSGTLPDLELTDEQGRKLRLADCRGQALALTFLYTRCPFPTMCPLLASKFAQAQKLLATDPQAPKNWRMLSVTIDPEHDTPEVLRSYGAFVKADPVKWNFATGSLADITRLALACGVDFWQEKGVLTHNLRTLVYNPQGRPAHVFKDNNWSPADLVREIEQAARP